VITGIVRVVLLDRYDRAPPVDYNYSILFCLSTFEVGLSFVAACAPSLKPIIAKIGPKIFGVNTFSGGKYSRSRKPSRLGYQLDQMSRRTEASHTKIGADAGATHDQGNQGGGVLTTKTEVRWHTGQAKTGSSTESLV
jgi:hypothetical protein